MKTKKQGNLPFSFDSVSVCAIYDRLLLYGTGSGPRTFGPVRIKSGSFHTSRFGSQWVPMWLNSKMKVVMLAGSSLYLWR